ncbi:MAG: hypothetical protein EXX96DRAFT_3831 [Benjaminiella poitrasii]|nr:MAG: hypothetical protein EXX96DRAFT_3831 [Benjaminiella poitrasii]
MAHNRQSIIDFFISTSDLERPSFKIEHDLFIDSDHKLLRFSFQTHPPSTIPSAHPRLTWNINGLQQPNTQLQYQQICDSESQALVTNYQPSLDSLSIAKQYIKYLSQGIKSSMYNALDATCKRQSNLCSDNRSDFWTHRLQQAFDHREKCHKQRRKAIGIRKPQLWLNHQ